MGFIWKFRLSGIIAGALWVGIAGFVVCEAFLWPHTAEPTQILGMPVTLFGPLATALLVLTGTITTSHITNSHQSDLKELELKFQVQKDIYLNAAEAIAEIQIAIGRYPYVKPGEIDDTAIHAKFAAAMNKMNVIASDTTLAAVHDFSEAFGIGILELQSKMIGVLALRSRSEIAQKSVTDLLKFREQINTQLSSLTPEERRGSQGDSLFSLFRSTEPDIQRLLKESETKGAELTELQQRVSFDAINLIAGLSERLAEVNIAVRSELRFKFDQEKYRERMRENSSKMKQAFADFISRVKSESEKYRVQ